MPRLKVLMRLGRKREERVPQADGKRDVYIVTCVDRQRITRFECVQVPKGQSPKDKNCPRCGKSVGSHDQVKRVHPRRPSA